MWKTDKDFVKTELVCLMAIAICFVIGAVYDIPDTKIVTSSMFVSWIVRQITSKVLENNYRRRRENVTD